MTSRWAASSVSTMRAAPLYCAVMGPTLTFTTPRYSSPSTSWSCAPGMHGAIRSRSRRVRHDSSSPASTRNVCSSFIGFSPPGRAGRRAYRRRLGSPVPVQSTSTAGWVASSARAPTSPRSWAAAGHSDRSRSTGLARVAVVGGDREGGAGLVGLDEASVGVGSDQRLVGEADADRVGAGGGEGAQRGPQRLRDAVAPAAGPHQPDVGWGDAADRPPGPADDEEHRVEAGGEGRVEGPGCRAAGRGGASTAWGCGCRGVSPAPRPGPRPRRSRRRRPGQAVASVRARRTSTRARCSR